MNLADADRAVARSLKLALAGGEGSAFLAAQIEKRLRAIAHARAFLDWDKVHRLADEIDDLRRTIATTLAEADIHAAVAQMRALIGLNTNVFGRCDDSNGMLGRCFDEAGADLGRLWCLLPEADRAGLPQELLGLLEADEHVVLTGLLAAASPALGTAGRAALRQLLEQKQPGRISGSRTPDATIVYPCIDMSERLMELADLDSDVTAFVAAVEASERPDHYAAEVGKRLIEAGRHEEALAWLDRARDMHAGDAVERTDLRLAALEALGRKSDAQSLRWASFCDTLNPGHLRAYLRALPDFADVDAEDRALAHVLAYPRKLSALKFLVGWPSLRAANDLVRAHHTTFDGRDYKELRPAADALASKYPGAATLLYRCLIEDVLARAASLKYRYAARDFTTCITLASALPDDLESHQAFTDRLRQKHGKKVAFWTLLPK